MRIGIIGGSSQVGSSIALYLKHLYDVEATCFIRSGYSSIFFDLFSIPVEKIDFNDGAVVKEQLARFDVILDCTYPSGQLFEIPALIEATSNIVLSAMRPGSSYIYMSSIMAYGMPADQKFIKEHFIPRSSYAYIKRMAEKKIRKLCAEHSIRPYIFRLGQVHGFLQSVSSSYTDKLRSQPVFYIDGNAQDLTNTIFISSICEAVLACGNHQQQPGLYTLVSDPQWTLAELYDYYLTQYHISTKLQFVPAAKKSNKGILSKLVTVAKKQRPLIESFVLMKIPALSIKLKGRYRENETRMEGAKTGVRYSDFNLLGKPDHPSVAGLKCGVDHIMAKEKEIEAFYNSMIKSGNREF